MEKRRRNLEKYKCVLNSKSNEEALVGSVLSLPLLVSLFVVIPFFAITWIGFCIDGILLNCV